MVLNTEEMVPSLNEVSCEIPGRLPNYLHRDVMPNIRMSEGKPVDVVVCIPWHSGDLASVVHVVERLVESMEVANARVAIILA